MLAKIVLFLCAFALVKPIWAEDNYTEVVQLKNGKIKGLVIDAGDQKKVQFFQAIRYGTATRFEKALPVGEWTGVEEATKQRDSCPQFGNQFDPSMKNVSISEDCLFLNLYRPVQPNTEKRAVMVWIHGGSFELGSIFSYLYKTQNFVADEDVIFVSIAYRLGPLGFITGGNVTPNLGLHDQILALKWVQENIEVFGGDPKRVTIFGESAGGMSVGVLVLSPLAKGLFNRAIAQSGAPLTFIEPLTNSLERTKKFAKKVNCTVSENLKETIQCIRGKSLAELVPATFNDFIQNELFLPVYGDELLPTRPSTALQSGKFNHVDYMYGVTKDEGTDFLFMFFPELAKEGTNLTVQSAKKYIHEIMTLYGKANHSQEVANYYLDKLKNPSQDDLKNAISDVWGDFQIVCPSYIFGLKLTKQLPVSNHVYAYRLMQALPAIDFGLGIPDKWMGVTHGQDLFYLFHPQMLNNATEAKQLSRQMVKDWTVFAKSGQPENSLWKESFNRETKGYSTRYFYLENGNMKLVSGHFRDACETLWKPIILV